MSNANNNTNGERDMSLPKYNQVSDSAINSLVNLNDLIKSGMTLTAIKAQASINGFSSIANSRTFKQVKSAINNELSNNGFIAV